MKRGQSGQSVIEFALVLPLLLLLLLGIAEFARAWLLMNVATSAAREGCRAAVLAAPDTTVSRLARNVLARAGVDPTKAAVVRTGPEEADQRVEVTVTTPFRLACGTVLPQLSGGLKSEFPLRATVAMRFQGGEWDDESGGNPKKKPK
jgi:Flp pilus assembly protein TadG